MNLKRYGNITWPLAAIVVLAGTAVAAPAAGQPARCVGESHEAANLLRDIRMDARQVRAHAWQWTMLRKRQTGAWYNFDRQWNEIKPPVEDMSMKLVRLEDMKAKLPAWEQQAMDGSKRLMAQITAETHDIRAELDSYYNGLSSPVAVTPKGDSAVLARDAGRLVRTVEPPAAGRGGMMKQS
jgi:hypothetical protein